MPRRAMAKLTSCSRKRRMAYTGCSHRLPLSLCWKMARATSVSRPKPRWQTLPPPVLKSPRRLALGFLLAGSRLRHSQRRYQADGNEEGAVLAADDLELRGVFFFAAAEAPHGIASHQFGDVRSEVAGLQRDLFGRAAHADR